MMQLKGKTKMFLSAKIDRLLGWLAGLALLLATGAGPVAASDEGYLIYDGQDINGFHLTVLANPNPVSVGKIHLLIRVGQIVRVTQEAPVRGARLLVEFVHLKGPGSDSSLSYLQRRNLVAEESEAGNYELSDSIQNEGTYQIGLQLEYKGQKVSTSFQVEAKPQPDDRLMSILLLSLFPLFLGWLVWMYLKSPSSPQTDIASTSPEPAPTEVHS